MNKFAITIIGPLALGFGALAGAHGLEACNATPAQVAQTFTDGWKLAGCVLSKVLVGIVDPASLLGCAGATEQLVIDILNDAKAQRAASPEAGVSAAQSAVYVQQSQWIDQAIQNMTVSLAKKAPGK